MVLPSYVQNEAHKLGNKETGLVAARTQSNMWWEQVSWYEDHLEGYMSVSQQARPGDHRRCTHKNLGTRDCTLKFATGVNIKIDIIQKVFEWLSCPFTIMIGVINLAKYQTGH